MNNYNIATVDTRIATRTNGKTLAQTISDEDGYLGLSVNSVGTRTFKNDQHKGYKLLSYGEQIGWVDSKDNFAHLKVLLGGKFENVMTVRGGLTINDDRKDLFSNEILDFFPEAEVQTEEVSVTAKDHAQEELARRISTLKAKLVRTITAKTKNWEGKAKKLTKLIKELEA